MFAEEAEKCLASVGPHQVFSRPLQVCVWLVPVLCTCILLLLIALHSRNKVSHTDRLDSGVAETEEADVEKEEDSLGEVTGVEVLVVSAQCEEQEARVVQALQTAGCCRRVTCLADPLTQELMTLAGPEQFIIDLINNQAVKIVLLEEEEEESQNQGLNFHDKNGLNARYVLCSV